jgi:hypothetical protein
MLKLKIPNLKLTLIALNFYIFFGSITAQNLRTILGGALKKEFQSQVGKINEKATMPLVDPTTKLIVNGQRFKLTTDHHAVCGSRINFVNFIRQEENNLLILDFYQEDSTKGQSCRTKSQCIKNEKSNETIGSWELLFTSFPKEQVVMISFAYSDSVKKFLSSKFDKDLKSTYAKYYLVGNSVYVLSANSLAEMKEKEIKKEVGNLIFKIEDGKIYDKDNKEVCSYEGNNNFDIMKLYFGRNFSILSAQISNNLDAIVADRVKAKLQKSINKLSEENAKLAAEYVKTEKKCLYCNNSYKGESFDFRKDYGDYGTKNPCAVPIIKVFYDKFCSRKCALDYCNSTH